MGQVTSEVSRVSRIATSVCHTTGRYPPPMESSSQGLLAMTDGVAADPIASVVIGRRLTPSFCAISSRSYPATANSHTVSRRAALAGRCFCARARRRPRSGWESSRTSLVVTPRLRRPAGTERAYSKTVPSLPFSRKGYHHKFLYGASLRVRTGLRLVPWMKRLSDMPQVPI